MTALPSYADASPTLRGEALFASPMEALRLTGALESAGLLTVSVDAVEPSARGRLREVIEAAIEAALEEKGAAPPGLGASTDLDASLSDQLFRARHIGANGFAIVLGDLSSLSNLASALDAEDSAVLRWWMAATAERPIVLLVDEANRHLGTYGPPVALERFVGRRQERGRAEPRSAASPSAPPSPAPSPPPPTEALAAPSPEAPAPAPPQASSAEQEIVAARPLPPPSEWRAWATELDAAKGPKPLVAIERLFASRYVPLASLLARGGGDGAARATIESWSSSFARSYTEAFGALRVTGKRPSMVLDVPQLANRIARSHGARSTQLVLVDSMRYDLGHYVNERMRSALGTDAACTEELLLWSALPTHTPTQLDLLARGPEGLALSEPSEREEHFTRGRGLLTLRRVKLGPRDVLKLDVVEARLREPGPPLDERFESLSDEIAEVLVAHARLLQPRTLMLVFGDHGFRMEADGGGSGPATQGGASPDEVLVPGFAWMIGGVH